MASLWSGAQQYHSKQTQSCAEKNLALSAYSFQSILSCTSLHKLAQDVTRCHKDFVETLMDRTSIVLHKSLKPPAIRYLKESHMSPTYSLFYNFKIDHSREVQC